MVKAQKDIKSSMKLIDIVIEVLDARIPVSSRNPNIDEFSKSKERIILLNKIDLADSKKTIEWKQKLEAQGYHVVLVNASLGDNIKEIISTIKKIGSSIYKDKYENTIKIEPIYRALIAGIPNVGKSTIINKMAKKNSANVGNKPGVTKKNQWIRIADNIDLLDTPGLLWPKFENPSVGINLALTGNIKQDILDVEELALSGIKLLLNSEYKEIFFKKYDIIYDKLLEIQKESEEYEELPIEYIVLEQIGRKRGCLVNGGIVDYTKAANIFLEDFKSGKIGKITLE